MFSVISQMQRMHSQGPNTSAKDSATQQADLREGLDRQYSMQPSAIVLLLCSDSKLLILEVCLQNQRDFPGRETAANDPGITGCTEFPG